VIVGLLVYIHTYTHTHIHTYIHTYIKNIYIAPRINSRPKNYITTKAIATKMYWSVWGHRGSLREIGFRADGWTPMHFRLSLLVTNNSEVYATQKWREWLCRERHSYEAVAGRNKLVSRLLNLLVNRLNTVDTSKPLVPPTHRWRLVDGGFLWSDARHLR